jgi:hypothetical protein
MFRNKPYIGEANVSDVPVIPVFSGFPDVLAVSAFRAVLASADVPVILAFGPLSLVIPVIRGQCWNF